MAQDSKGKAKIIKKMVQVRDMIISTVISQNLAAPAKCYFLEQKLHLEWCLEEFVKGKPDEVCVFELPSL